MRRSWEFINRLSSDCFVTGELRGTETVVGSFHEKGY